MGDDGNKDWRIYEAINDNALSYAEIARRSGCSIKRVARILRKQGITPKKLRVDAIKKQVAKGNNEIDKISSALNMSPSTIREQIGDDIALLRKTGKYYRPVKRIPLIDLIVQEQIGLTQDHLGELCGVTGERIRQYLCATEQYEMWKKGRFLNPSRCETLNKNEIILNELRPVLEEIMIKKAKEKSWSYRKAAIAYSQTRKRYRTPEEFQNLLNLFRYCRRALENEGEICIRTASEETKLAQSKIRRILWTVNLQYDAKIKYRSTKEEARDKIEKIIALRKIGIPVGDIVNFLNTNTFYIWKHSKAEPETKSFVVKFSMKGIPKNCVEKHLLTYFKASKVYEAKDAGNFSEEEIREWSGLDKITANYALEHRNEIEPKLLEIVSIVKGTKSEKPYL